MIELNGWLKLIVDLTFNLRLILSLNPIFKLYLFVNQLVALNLLTIIPRSSLILLSLMYRLDMIHMHHIQIVISYF
jgi:hypothetical protein